MNKHSLWLGWALVLGWAACAAGAEPAKLAFVADGNGFRFDTGVLRGSLRKDGKSIGLLPAVHVPSGAQLASSMGLFSHYRLLDAQTRYGVAAWEWKSQARLRDDGAVEVTWAPDEAHPFEMKAVYRWKSADTLDLVTSVSKPPSSGQGSAMRGFEVFVSSYFAGFEESLVSAKGGFRRAEQPAGVWQTYPRDEKAIALYQDGRWQRPPHPVDWVMMPKLEGCVAMRRDGKTGLVAVVMAMPQECFAISTPYGQESHRSLYLSLFGQDLREGQTIIARSRLVIRSGISEAQAMELYRSFAEEQKGG